MTDILQVGGRVARRETTHAKARLRLIGLSKRAPEEPSLQQKGPLAGDREIQAHLG